jgi:glutamate:GABA antiporter
MSLKDSKRVIGLFTLAMINVAAIAGLKNLPVLAEYGWKILIYLGLATLCFFIPTALICAELASGWPERGGVYVWVARGLGKRCGFVAIWLQWLENTIWYPTILSFAAGSLAYAIDPALASNRVYMALFVLVVYWGCTLIDSLGMRVSGFLSSVGAIIGTLVPGALIIILGIIWVADGRPLTPDSTALASGNTLTHIALFIGVLFSLAGIEMSAVHAQEVAQPHRNYPRAILLSGLLILLLYTLGSLAIAMVVPVEKLSLVSGVLEAFSIFFSAYGLAWLVPILAILITIGALAMVATWIVGPSKGLQAAAADGDMPSYFSKTNRWGMPVHLLLSQGTVVSLLSLLFLFMPTVNSSWWLLTALTAQLYLGMYLLLFIAAIRLRYILPHVERPYRIPGGKLGIWCVAGLGIVTTLVAIVVGFIPPPDVHTGTIFLYESFLVLAILFALAIPMIITQVGLRSPHH